MTIQEAINDIQNNILPVVGGKSLLMAIEALKAQDAKPEEKDHQEQGESAELGAKTGETCADAISRQACDLIDRQAVRFIESESKYEGDWNQDYEDGFSDALEKVLALPSVQPLIRTEMSSADDMISRQAAIDASCIDWCNRKYSECPYFDNVGTDEKHCDGCDTVFILKDLPSAQPEINKQELIRTMNAGIIATDAKDVYSCGMRNGIRWCRALLEDDPPNFEDASGIAEKVKELPSVQPEQKTCEGCKHSGQWENELEYGASCPCLVCKRRASDNYERSD